jgi:hypothetical protein
MSNILTNNINPRSGNVINIGGINDKVSIAGTLSYEDVSNIDSVGIITARQGVHYGDVGSGVTITAVGAGTSLGFLVNDSERVRIDNSGRLLVGTTGGSAETLVVIQGNSSATAGDGMLHLSRGSEPTTSVAGAEIGQIKFAAEVNDEAVIIKGERDGGTWTSGSSHPGRLLFYTTTDGASSPTFRMIIKSDGKVGINTDVPAAILTTRAGGFDPTDNTVFDGVGLFLSSNVAAGDGNYGSALAWNRPGSDANFKTAIAPVQEGADVDLQGLAFFTANGTFTSSDPIERMRLDNIGRLRVGTTDLLETASNSIIQAARGDGAYIILGRDNTSVTNGNLIGGMRFYGNDSDGNYDECARFNCVADGTHSDDSKPSRLQFWTTANGASSPTERMRINSSGFQASTSTGNGIEMGVTASAGTSTQIFRGRHSATAGSYATGTVAFNVFSNGNVENINDSYGVISDIKLKENIVDAESQWDDFKAVRFRKYNFKEETGYETHTQLGVIAQELELISPGLVYETPDLDEEGNDLGTTTKAVKSSVLVKKALVALQEAMERIETLETQNADLLTRVSALEG